MVRHNQGRNRLRPLSTLVLGWPQAESIECCATTQPIKKPQTAPSSSLWHLANNETKQPPKWKNFLSRRLRRQRRRQDGTDKEETLESVRDYKDHVQEEEEDDDDALCVESFVRIETTTTHRSSPGVECVLPRVLDDYRQDDNDNDNKSDCEDTYWSWLFRTDSLYFHETTREDDDDDDNHVVEDDVWCAAKRGDVEALQQIEAASTKMMDWTRTDGFGNTALYYACHSGAARDMNVVRHLLRQWQGPIPTPVLERCKTNAIHQGVVRLLEKHVMDESRQQQEVQEQSDSPEEEDDDETVTLFGLFQEEGDY